MKRHAILLAIALVLPLGASAQHDPVPAAAAAPAEARQFDFLLGQWDLDVHLKVGGLAAMIHGTPKLVGTWKAWPIFDGQGIEDEMRIVDVSGNTLSLVRALRMYVKSAQQWKIGALDITHERSSQSSAHWRNGEMLVEGQFTEAEGKPTLTRTRYTNISGDAFRMQQDRSTDNGQSWDEDVLTIDAKRVAASASPG